MRISLLAFHFAEYAGRLALALAERHAVEVHFSVFNLKNELADAFVGELRDKGVLVHVHPRPHRRKALLDGFRVARRLRRFRPDVIHVQEAASWTVLAALALARAKRKTVLTVHDPMPHPGADVAVRSRTAWAVQRVRAMSDEIIVHGERLVDDLRRLAPGLRAELHAVEHGVLGDFRHAGEPQDAKSFLFFGRIQAYKGLGILLDAVDLLADRGVDFKVTIAGTGPDLERYRDRINASRHIDLDERFIPADETVPIFARHAFVVMPYISATQSGVAAYALAAGRPLAITRVGALTEIIEDGVNGIVVEPSDAGQLADAMERLIREPAFRKRIATGALATAAGRLSWARIAEKTENIYRRAV